MATISYSFHTQPILQYIIKNIVFLLKTKDIASMGKVHMIHLISPAIQIQHSKTCSDQTTLTIRSTRYEGLKSMDKTVQISYKSPKKQIPCLVPKRRISTMGSFPSNHLLLLPISKSKNPNLTRTITTKKKLKHNDKI